ncbi:hypothetical protein CEXT_800971 [Caerostris extrusa]|uniref:Uncharacterized protein n=1 Tax=Caerostris extrusa TaxID=172846 RepID=A0AAV4WMR9_CAEEX|nr:hypothetical protein CEXT_800971 [Caerostris extrusa]
MGESGKSRFGFLNQLPRTTPLTGKLLNPPVSNGRRFLTSTVTAIQAFDAPPTRSRKTCSYFRFPDGESPDFLILSSVPFLLSVLRHFVYYYFTFFVFLSFSFKLSPPNS